MSPKFGARFQPELFAISRLPQATLQNLEVRISTCWSPVVQQQEVGTPAAGDYPFLIRSLSGKESSKDDDLFSPSIKNRKVSASRSTGAELRREPDSGNLSQGSAV